MTPAFSTTLLRTQTDERLVRLAGDGHDRAFEAIVERYRRPLTRYLRRMLPQARAEDALQQTFMSAWSSLGDGAQVRELRGWLYRIAHNSAMRSLSRGGYDYDELHESVQGAATTAEDFERREVMRRTLAGVAELPARQRDALLAIAIQGRPHAEVAAELGLSDGALRQLVHRARATLRAGVSAVTPMPLVQWLMGDPGAHEQTARRIAEIATTAGGAGAAAAIKVGAVAVTTAALIAPQVVNILPAHRPRHATVAHTASARRAPATVAPRPVHVQPTRRLVALAPATTAAVPAKPAHHPQRRLTGHARHHGTHPKRTPAPPVVAPVATTPAYVPVTTTAKAKAPAAPIRPTSSADRPAPSPSADHHSAPPTPPVVPILGGGDPPPTTPASPKPPPRPKPSPKPEPTPIVTTTTTAPPPHTPEPPKSPPPATSEPTTTAAAPPPTEPTAPTTPARPHPIVCYDNCPAGVTPTPRPTQPTTPTTPTVPATTPTTTVPATTPPSHEPPPAQP